MNQLPTVVLIAGLVGGAIAAWLLARSSKGATGSHRKKGHTSADHDLSLQATDLQLQLDELYGQLRDAGLPESERQALELRAAKTLQRIEELPKEAVPRDNAADLVEKPAQQTGTSWFAQHPMAAGILLGGGMVALVAALIALAFGDTGLNSAPAATATSPPVSQGPAANSQGSSANFRGEPELPPFVAQQVAEMRESLVLTPNDLATRQRLVETLLANEQHFDAFSEANQLLELNPEDPVGHYAAGFVRYVMGQADAALGHLDRSIRSDPSFSQAYLVQGLILLQQGAREAAIGAWEDGLAASQGQDGRIEHLLGLARQGLSFEEILQTPPSN